MQGIDAVRVRAVGEAVKAVGPEAVEAMERSDPQYTAVEAIARRHGAAALAIVVANALVSYRLRVTGEEYWSEYARWWSHRPSPRSASEVVEAVKRFLAERGLAMNVEQKAARLSRAKPLIDHLMSGGIEVLDLDELLEAVRKVLRPRGYEKTIHFALKMAYYAAKALGLRLKGGLKAEMPLDRRIAVLTSSSGMVRACPDEVYTRLRSEAVKAWSGVARISGKHVFQLDTLLWLPARGVEEKLRRGLLASARDDYARRLVLLSRSLINWAQASNLAAQILYTNPFTGCKTS